ncbi:hypothetical protein ACFL6S_13540 [Candidatus Poribacteria bacterium]
MLEGEWRKNHRRYFQIAGITIQVDSDLPITDTTFRSKFKVFEVDGKGEDTITIRHHFSIPDLGDRDLGKEVYRKLPWAIYRKEDSWIYLGISSETSHIWGTAILNYDHTKSEIYSSGEEYFLRGDLHSLTCFPTDQILLARILADREGYYLHSGGVILDDKGFVFVGHSDAGKSTMVTMLKDEAEILCDDRIIVRRWPEGFRAHGTWSHGDIPDVSANSAPLRAIMFLEQAQDNRLLPLNDQKEIMRRVLACLIKPLVTTDWWEKTLDLVEKMIQEVPFYIVQFDKSGRVLDLLKNL